MGFRNKTVNFLSVQRQALRPHHVVVEPGLITKSGIIVMNVHGMICHKSARRRVSRVLSRISRGWPFLWDARCRAPRATHPSGGAKARPVSRITPGYLPLLLGLAPGGVFPAAAVAGGAVRSYRTVSPLPTSRHRYEPAVYFLWHFP